VISGLWLSPCVPNPLTAFTEITYGLPALAVESVIRLSIFDPTGRLVRDLLSAHHRVGMRTVCWDGTDRTGRPVQGGVYFWRLRVGDEQKTRQMLVVR
jgi:flagellar hook assembly protein FlgD